MEYNEWTYERETWSEVQVANSETGAEISIPRLYIGSGEKRLGDGEDAAKRPFLTRSGAAESEA